MQPFNHSHPTDVRILRALAHEVSMYAQSDFTGMHRPKDCRTIEPLTQSADVTRKTAFVCIFYVKMKARNDSKIDLATVGVSLIRAKLKKCLELRVPGTEIVEKTFDSPGTGLEVMS